jgi:hypothetical protein
MKTFIEVIVGILIFSGLVLMLVRLSARIWYGEKREHLSKLLSDNNKEQE